MMEVWLLFVCGISVADRNIQCNTWLSRTEVICRVEETRVRGLDNTPLAAVCFSMPEADVPADLLELRGNEGETTT